MKKVLLFKICLMCVVIMALLAILIIGITNNGFGFSCNINGFNNFRYSNSSRYKVALNELKMNPIEINHLEINWYGGEVIVNDNADVEEISIKEDYSIDITDKYKLHYLLDNNKLIIQFCDSMYNVKRSVRNAKTLTINIPQNSLTIIDIEMIQGELEYNGNNTDLSDDETNLTLELETVSGNININNTRYDNLSIENISGKTDLTNVTIDNITEIDLVSGKATLTNFTCNSLKGETVSGNLSLKGYVQVIKLETVSGDVFIDLENAPTKIDCDTISGNVEIKMVDNDGFTAEIDSVSGDLSVESSSSLDITKKKDAVIYKNGGMKYNFDSVSGDVKITIK